MSPEEAAEFRALNDPVIQASKRKQIEEDNRIAHEFEENQAKKQKQDEKQVADDHLFAERLSTKASFVPPLTQRSCAAAQAVADNAAAAADRASWASGTMYS